MEGSDTLASRSIDHVKSLGLKVISKGTHYDFYYSLKDEKWELLCKDIDARYLSTANTGGFTGSTIGLYATRNNQ